MTDLDIAINIAIQGMSLVLFAIFIVIVGIKILQKIVNRKSKNASTANANTVISNKIPKDKSQILIKAALEWHFQQR